MPRFGPKISWQLGTFRAVGLRRGRTRKGEQIVCTSGATEKVIRVSTISLVPVFGFNRFAPLNSIYIFATKKKAEFSVGAITLPGACLKTNGYLTAGNARLRHTERSVSS